MTYTWKHRLSEIDTEKRTAICQLCGPTTLKRNGEKKYRCSGSRGPKESYQLEKGDKCERCGFVAEHRCQLDVHHRDNDRTNNDPANLRTLCANCHRLVSFSNRTLYLDTSRELIGDELFSNI